MRKGGFTPLFLTRKRLYVAGRAGFTLIELLVVIVIIGILASVSIPTYIRTVEKVRAGEAITNLQLIRAGEKVYKLELGTFTWAAMGSASAINTNLNLDIEPEFWSYDVSAGTTTTFTATSTRNAPGSTYDGTITINQDGWDSSGTSPFQP